MGVVRAEQVDTAVPAEVRARLLVRFGPSAARWCDGLPALVAELAGRWGLTVLASGGGGTARVFRCARDGAAVWLKLTPDPQVAAEEAAALRAWAELPSVVDLLEDAPESAALLLADVRPGTLLRARPWRPAEPAALLTALRSVAPGAVPVLRPLRERVAFLYALTERRAPGAVPDRLREEALALADSGPRALVHGDLHPANVLDGPDGGLVAIDPRPSVGDPDFDLVDWALEGAVDRAGLERRIAELTALVPGADPNRVLAWCRALAPVVAAPRAAAGRRDAETAFLLSLAGI